LASAETFALFCQVTTMLPALFFAAVTFDGAAGVVDTHAVTADVDSAVTFEPRTS